MALVTVQRSPSVGNICDDAEDGEGEDTVLELVEIETPKRAPKLGRMRSPSFEGYFASKSGAFALSDGILARSESSKTCGELQFHLQRMVTLLRQDDILRMAVRLESQIPSKKRYLALVTDANDSFSAVLGIDWIERPTIGLVLPIFSSSIVTLDGDGGFHIKSGASQAHMFKPVSVQTLWSAIHVTYKAIEVARGRNYFPGGPSHTLINHYKSKLDSDYEGVSEWNLMEGIESTSRLDIILSEKEEEEQLMIKKLIKQKLKEVMMKVDLDDVTSKEIRTKVEDEINMDLTELKEYVDTEMLTILGQMDSASKILDYLYLGSEWNASNYDELIELGIGYVLNVTREIDNFFPGSFAYYNVRVWDIEESDLLHHWDHTYRFINQARQAGSKVLVHCRMGISRSSSTVIAYLLKSEGWSLTQCIEHVRSCRSIIQPNPGFQKQLIIYEGILNSSRNRYSALFRQRSRSEINRVPSVEQKRKMFKKTRSSKEVEDDENEPGKTSQDEKETADQEDIDAPRPKSWSGTPSLKEVSVEFDADLETNGKEAFNGDLTKCTSPVMTESSEIESMEVDTSERQDTITSEERDRNERLLKRAKTLPVDALDVDEKEAEGEESIGELPVVSKRGQRAHLKRQVTDADLDSLISEDVKERNENLMKQAFMASEIKSQLLRSLEQAGRVTKHKMDEEFSVESIIKPSSLRKLSKTRRLSVERRKSLSEHNRAEQYVRQRSFTEATPRSSLSESDEPTTGDNCSERPNTSLPVKKSSKRTFESDVEAQQTKSKGTVRGNCDLPSNSSSNSRSASDGVEMNNTHNDQNVHKRTESRYKQFLIRSKSNVKEDSRRRTLDDKQLRKGLGELFKSRDLEAQKSSSATEEELVVKDSQFSTVEESKKRIEERVRQHTIRSLRSPRRRTVGGSELSFQRKKTEVDCTKSGLIPPDAESTQDKMLETTSTQLRQKNVLANDMSDPLPSPGRVRRNAKNYEGCGHAENVTSEHEQSGVVIEGDHPPQESAKLDEFNNKNQEINEVKDSSNVDDDVSVRELVKFHSEVIRQLSTSPSTSGSPTEGSPPNRISPVSADVPEPIVMATVNASEQSTTEVSAPKSDIDDSLSDLALKGIVKKHTEVFSKASLPMSLPPVSVRRRVHTLPRGKRTCISPFKSFDGAVHSPVSRVKSLPTSKSESEIDSEVESILGVGESTASNVRARKENKPEDTSMCVENTGTYLSLPLEDVCIKSAPASPDCARREPPSDVLKDRSSSFDSLQLESHQERTRSSFSDD